MHSSKVKNDHESSFRRKPESSNSNLLQKIWTPVFTGVTTFDEFIKNDVKKTAKTDRIPGAVIGIRRSR